MTTDYATHIERDEEGLPTRLALQRIPAPAPQTPADTLRGGDGGAIAPTGQGNGLQGDSGERLCSRQDCRRPLRGRQVKWCSDACYWKVWDRNNPRQRALPLEPPPVPVVPVRDQRVPKAERKRLGGMSLVILLRLREGQYGATPGTVSNRDFAEMFPAGAAWRTRISDVRLWLERSGETIRCRVEPGGLAWYWIEPVGLEGRA